MELCLSLRRGQCAVVLPGLTIWASLSDCIVKSHWSGLTRRWVLSPQRKLRGWRYRLRRIVAADKMRERRRSSASSAALRDGRNLKCKIGLFAISWDLALVCGSRRRRWVLPPDRVIAQGLSATGRTIPPTSSHLISRMIWTKYTSTSTISAGAKQPGRDRRMTERGLRERLEVQHAVSEGQAWRNICVCH